MLAEPIRLRSIAEPLGRTLEQRTTLYGRIQTVGRRLRPAEPHDHTPPVEATPVTLSKRVPVA